jgi:predicted ferric reductase
VRPPRVTATILLVLTWLGAALAVLHGIVSAGLPIVVGAALVAHVTGMAAGYGAAIMLILMSRSPWLEGGVGSHRLARWHAWGGQIVIILTLLHATAVVLAWAHTGSMGLRAAARDVLDIPGLPTAFIGSVMLVLVGLASLRVVRRRISYEGWHFLHLLTYLAVAFGFARQLAGPDFAGRRWLQIAWSLLYTYAFALVLRWRVLQPLFQLWRHRLRVEEVRQESADVVSVLMSGRHLDELRAEPGQFFRWRFLTAKTWGSAYPFSLSAPPHSSPIAGHCQGPRRWDKADLPDPHRNACFCRRPVRCPDDSMAAQAAGVADRGRRRDYTDAGALRGDRPARQGRHAGLPCLKGAGSGSQAGT